MAWPFGLDLCVAVRCRVTALLLALLLISAGLFIPN
jgi:hypothetical protein